MKFLSNRVKNRIMILCITALAIAMGCAFAACTKAQAESSPEKTMPAADAQESVAVTDEATDETVSAADNYSRWLSDHYSAAVHTREMWLDDLQSALGLMKANGAETTFEQAFRNGIIDSVDEDAYHALTRRYVAQTLVRALHYEYRDFQYATDLKGERELQTVTYYGYFLPDENDMVYPDAVITEDEYQPLLDEVARYARLKGKHALSFGDSIMFGRGNRDRGISDITCEKYGMTVSDYAISGATFGVDKGHSHIADQIKTAAKANVVPDMIFLNGGTNDMCYVTRGEVVVGYDPKDVNERTFAGGFEYAASLLQKYWKDVPVLYIRAHDMDCCDDAVEQDYGDLAMTMAEKWGMVSLDLYNDTDFCTEIDYIRDTYTAYKARLGHSDGIHPTAYGYAKYYLPPVAEKVAEILIHE